MSTKNRFIALEGLSGTGKTTIAKLVAEKIGGCYYSTPPDFFNEVRKKIDENTDNAARFLFYLSGIFFASNEMREILKKRSVVCDRYVLTTLCYHRALGVKLNIPEFFLKQIIKPDKVFLVTCEERERIKRLNSRGLTQNDINERRFCIDAKFLQEYRKHRPIEIDNSSNSPTFTAEKIIKILKG